MSRMQNILDKAARDGAVLRTNPLPALHELTPPAAGVTLPDPAAQAFVVEPTLADAGQPLIEEPHGRPARLHPSLVAALAPDDATAQQYRGLCARIVHADQTAPVHVILVTSAETGEGKSTTASNLALTLSREYHRPV